MSAIVAELRLALEHPNVQALLRVIRAGESSQEAQAYRWLYGSTRKRPLLFESFADHPRQAFKSPWGWTSAAGAYQAMCAVPGRVKTDTWGDFQRAVGPLDFSPASQDLFAAWCIRRRGALADAKEGRFHEAVRKCAKEWASLPGSPYGQPTKTWAQAEALYLEHGGQLAAAKPTQPKEEVKSMSPIILPLIQAAASLIPQLGQLFGSGSEVANRNVAAATIVADQLVKATEAVNLQEAVEKIQTDPAALQAATHAIADVWPSIVESGGGGIKAARDAATAPEGNWRKAFLNPAFVIGMVLLGLVCFVVVVIVMGLGAQNWSDEIKAMVVTAVVSGALASVTGFFLGSSLGSQKKDAALMNKGG